MTPLASVLLQTHDIIQLVAVGPCTKGLYRTVPYLKANRLRLDSKTWLPDVHAWLTSLHGQTAAAAAAAGAAAAAAVVPEEAGADKAAVLARQPLKCLYWPKEIEWESQTRPRYWQFHAYYIKIEPVQYTSVTAAFPSGAA